MYISLKKYKKNIWNLAEKMAISINAGRTLCQNEDSWCNWTKTNLRWHLSYLKESLMISLTNIGLSQEKYSNKKIPSEVRESGAGFLATVERTKTRTKDFEHWRLWVKRTWKQSGIVLIVIDSFVLKGTMNCV